MLLHTEETVCFRNSTLKANLSARCCISRLSCCWVHGGNAACVKESPFEDKNSAGLPWLMLRHYAFFFVRTYQFVSGGKKVGEERSFSHKAQVIHDLVAAEHWFACSGTDRGLLMSCDPWAQSKPLSPSVSEIRISSVWRFELLPSYAAQRYDRLYCTYDTYNIALRLIVTKRWCHWFWGISRDRLNKEIVGHWELCK